ncbi:MAG: TraM recognition domain-containing protein [Oligoflexia bacterium]|nr:TraM recognition domain-containing protein [Oligoflexia bacterium]
MKFFKKATEGLYLGLNEVERATYLPDLSRTMHTQILGATGVGKTESGIFPMIFDDLLTGRSVLFIDPKADSSTIQTLIQLCSISGRSQDLIHIDLGALDPVTGYNPMKVGSPSELKDKIVGSILWTEEFYKKVSERVLLNTFSLFREAKLQVSISDVCQFLRDPSSLEASITVASPDLAEEYETLRAMIGTSQKNLEGLMADLELWTRSDMGKILMNHESDSVLDWIKAKKVVYVSLNTLAFEESARRFGRLILQDLKTAVQRLQALDTNQRPIASVYVDEFASVASSGFIELLNKARSANVRLTLAHQSLGDLTQVSDSFADQILDNTNVKMIFRLDSPDTSDFFSRLIGTRKSEKKTVQISGNGILGASQTGMGTSRDTEEFIFSPNEFRRLARGEALVLTKIPFSVSKVRLQGISKRIEAYEENESKRRMRWPGFSKG